jgi:ABC-2 type transport system permease protein
MFAAIIHKELRLLSRDVHALAVLFLLPVIFILTMSLALQNEMEEDQAQQLKIGIWVESAASQPPGLVEALRRIEGFQTRAYADRTELLQALRPDDLTALVMLPAGFSAAVLGGEPADEDKLQLVYAARVPLVLRRLILATLSKTLVSYRMNLLFESGFMALPNPVAQQRIVLDAALITTRDTAGNQAPEHPSSVQQSVPAWLIFSMFFVVIPISTTLLTERQQGTLQRLSSFPVPGSYLLLGKLIPYFGINMIQTLLMFLVGIHLVPLLGGVALELPQAVWPLALVAAAVSLTAISFALLIATKVQSSEQATTIGGLSNLILAAIGGIMVPSYIMPDFMQKAAAMSPMNWGLEGFFSILLRDGGLAMAAPEIMKLLSLAAGLFLWAVYSYRGILSR